VTTSVTASQSSHPSPTFMTFMMTAVTTSIEIATTA
jgi:hypothetical protein